MNYLWKLQILCSRELNFLLNYLKIEKIGRFWLRSSLTHHSSLIILANRSGVNILVLGSLQLIMLRDGPIKVWIASILIVLVNIIVFLGQTLIFQKIIFLLHLREVSRWNTLKRYLFSLLPQLLTRNFFQRNYRSRHRLISLVLCSYLILLVEILLRPSEALWVVFIQHWSEFGGLHRKILVFRIVCLQLIRRLLKLLIHIYFWVALGRCFDVIFGIHFFVFKLLYIRYLLIVFSFLLKRVQEIVFGVILVTLLTFLFFKKMFNHCIFRKKVS